MFLEVCQTNKYICAHYPCNSKVIYCTIYTSCNHSLFVGFTYRQGNIMRLPDCDLISKLKTKALREIITKRGIQCCGLSYEKVTKIVSRASCAKELLDAGIGCAVYSQFFYSLWSESKRTWILFASYPHVSVYSPTPFVRIIRFIFASKYSHKFACKYSFSHIFDFFGPKWH